MKANLLIFVNLMLLSLLFEGCGKSKQSQTQVYSYAANPSYNGLHPISNFAAEAYLKEESEALQLQVDLKGTSDTLAYPVSIHEYDSTQAFGYKPSPFLSLGEYEGNIPLIKTFSTLDFVTFVNEFKGYLIVQDPLNKSNDTNKLLIFGKIGSQW